MRPQVVVTYDDFGGYGHPDHIQAHRVAMYGVALAEAPSFRPDLGAAHSVAKVYWTAFPKGVLRAGIEELRAAGETTGFAAMDPDDLQFGIDDDLVTAAIDGSGFYEHKLNAMRAHATQISLDSGFFALSNNIGSPTWSTEYFRLVRGQAAGPVRRRRPRDGPLRRGVTSERARLSPATRRVPRPGASPRPDRPA